MNIKLRLYRNIDNVSFVGILFLTRCFYYKYFLPELIRIGIHIFLRKCISVKKDLIDRKFIIK